MDRRVTPPPPSTVAAKREGRSKAGEHAIGTYLILLVVVSLVPMIVIGGVLVWKQAYDQKAELDRRLLTSAKALSLAVDVEIEGKRRMLMALAESTGLGGGDLSAFRDAASRSAIRHEALFVSVYDADGTLVLSTSRSKGQDPFALAAPPMAHATAALPSTDGTVVSRVFELGSWGNSDLFRGDAGYPIFTVGIPVLRNGKVVYALKAGFAPQLIADLITQQEEFTDAMAAIIDGNGFIIARSVDGARAAGQGARVLAGIPQPLGRQGVASGSSKDDVGLQFAYNRSFETGWTAVVGIDESVLQAARTRDMLVAAGLLIVGAIVALVFAAALARRVRYSVERLVAAAAGSNADGTGTGIREFNEVERALLGMSAARSNEGRERERRLVAEVRRQEAEAESRRKDIYLATLAHELRNPLAPIRYVAEVLRQGPPAPADAAQIGEIIDRQVGHMAHLLDDLLDVSRIARGKLVLRKTRMPLANAIRDALEATKPALDAAGQCIELELPSQAVWVEGDHVRLTQIFANLLNNAARYSDPGGRVRVCLEARRDEAVVTVKDQGIGIAPGALENVFEPFSQADRARTRSQGGLGIGLSLVKGLVELHGGNVQARSEGDGRGTEFVVRLPRAVGAAEAEAVEAGRGTVKAVGKKKVLVVDDNRDAADTLALLLRAAGTRVEVAYDGASALEAAKRGVPDVAVLDVGMPGMDGYELAQRLSAIPERPCLIAVTGFGQESDRAAAARAGFDHHLTKPVQAARLLELIAGA